MSVDRPTRQELYDRIRASSKDQVILEEMIRLGFVPKDGGLPDEPLADIQRMGEIQRQLRALRKEHADLNDVERLKRRARRARMDAALQRRKETRARKERRRQERAARHVVNQATGLNHLGVGVSEGLGGHGGTPRYGLPTLPDAASVAASVGVDVGELRWLAYHRPVSAVSHYRQFVLPKKTGGERLISAPMPRLKAVQHWCLRSILDQVPVHDAAHGFVKGRSIVTNARPHVGRRIVVNLDLKDFFPSVSWVRVRGVFASLGYGSEVATLLALLCTEAPTTEVELDGRRWFVATGERVLPQGSPASPAITNILCWALDRRLSGLAGALGFTYTRYADDLTFSTSADGGHVGTLLTAVGQIVDDEGFVVHPAKTRVMRSGSRQEVTGLVVNDTLTVSRTLRRTWKAAMFRLDRDGLDAVSFGTGRDTMASLMGFAQFVAMVTPDVGAPMVERARTAARGLPSRERRTTGPAPRWPEVRQEAIARRARAVAEARRVLDPSAPAPSPAAASMAGTDAPPPVSAAHRVENTGPSIRSPDEPMGSRGQPDTPPPAKGKARWWEVWRWFED